MRFLLIFLLFIQGRNLYAQSDVRRVSVEDLPEDIQNIQNISTVVRWTDSLGDNVMVVTRKVIQRDGGQKIVDSSNNRYRSPGENFPREMVPAFAYHFEIVKDSAILTWKVVGISKVCDDERVNHTKNWFVVTDLNKNSRAEVWLIYKADCMGDDHSGNMKIVMHENDIKYSMNGFIDSDDPIVKYLDYNFLHGQEVFRKYALQLWRDFEKK
jgi:hypothetical protein